MFETCFIYDLDTVKYQLYSDSKFIKLQENMSELWHFQALRGKKKQIAEKRTVELCVIVVNDQHPNSIHSKVWEMWPNGWPNLAHVCGFICNWT